MHGTFVSRVLLGIAVSASIYLVAPTAHAQSPGDTVSFLVSQGTEITVPTGGDPGDKVVYSGRSTGTTDGGACAAGTDFAIQNAVLVDPRNPGVRTSRLTGIITVSQSGSVAPGTRLTSIQTLATCVISGVGYDKYSGTVE